MAYLLRLHLEVLGGNLSFQVVGKILLKENDKQQG